MPADETVLSVLRRWYFARRADSGFRLLGFPRNVLQALVLDEWMETRGETLDACVWSPCSASAATPVVAYYRERGLLIASDELAASAFSRP